MEVKLAIEMQEFPVFSKVHILYFVLVENMLLAVLF